MGEWRNTLFVWRGKLQLNFTQSCEFELRWSGSWLPLENGQDATELCDETFAASPNTFEMVCKPDVEEDHTSSWSWQGSYLLDNGDGHERFKDIEHRLRVFDRFSNKPTVPVDENWHDRYCVGWGTTEFGVFTSGGWINGRTLTIARRYLIDKDTRRGPREAPHIDTSLIWSEPPSHNVVGNLFLEKGLPFRVTPEKKNDSKKGVAKAAKKKMK